MNTMKINMCFLSNVVKAGLSMAVLLFSAAAGNCRPQTKNSEDIHYDGEPVVFSAEDGTSFRVHYADDTEHVLLILNGERYPLVRTISGSGARYANEDESIVYWSKGRSAFMEVDEDGSIVYWIKGISAFIQVDGEIVLRGRGKDSETIHYDGEPVVYRAEGGKSFRVHYADDTEHVLLILNREPPYPLVRTISGSGTRYANEDESIVYWSKGRSAFIQVDGEIVLDGREAVIDEQNLSQAALNQSQSQ